MLDQAAFQFLSLRCRDLCRFDQAVDKIDLANADHKILQTRRLQRSHR